MPSRQVAENLISARTKREREKILFREAREKDLELAKELKTICYEVWTSEPAKAQKTALALETLVAVNPLEEIDALRFWVTGIADLTRGKLEKAIADFDRSAALFFRLGKEHDAANTHVAKLIALALLGKYGEAVETGKAALAIFEKYGDRLATGKIENNIGNIFLRQENPANAEKYFLSARKNFLALKNTEQLILSEIGLANTYSAMNDFRNADKFYRKTLANAQKLKMFLRQAEIETNIGSLALYRGRYSDALKFLELSRQKYEALEMPHQTIIAELEIADAYLELNLTREAFEIYKRVVPALAKLKIQGEEARANTRFGQAAVVVGEKSIARKAFQKAAELFGREKNDAGLAFVKLNEAQFEAAEKKYRRALKFVGQAQDLMSEAKNRRHFYPAQFLKGEILRHLGRLEEAERILAETSKRSLRENQPQIAQLCQIALAKIYARRNQTSAAVKHYRRAIGLIEKLRAPLPAEEFRMAFLSDKLAPFEGLAKIHLARKSFEKAFLMLEKARARTLSESLMDSARLNDSPADEDKLVRRLANLREELNWFYSRLNRADAENSAGLQTEAARREKQISDVMRQIESAKNAGGAATNGLNTAARAPELNFKALREALGERKVLIEFASFDDRLSAFVISGEKIDFVDDLASENEILGLLEGLQFQFGALRYNSESLRAFMPELKKRADAYLRNLYRKLIEPLEKFIGGRDLVIVPVGAAHYVPFHALDAGEKYLIETREIVYAPSATVWQFLNKNTAPNVENALLIGFADERIPQVEREIEALQKIFPGAKAFTGERATFANYTKNAPACEILHLACHGQFRPDNPMFSSLHLADGYITVRDICAQRLNAEVVTLSACETGLNKIYAGDEILGLARGFLAAGAKNLILSLWTVSDEATARLMSDFYENLQRGAGAAASLRAAQLNFIKTAAHPYFWSPFALIGR